MIRLITSSRLKRLLDVEQSCNRLRENLDYVIGYVECFPEFYSLVSFVRRSRLTGLERERELSRILDEIAYIRQQDDRWTPEEEYHLLSLVGLNSIGVDWDAVAKLHSDSFNKQRTAAACRAKYRRLRKRNE